MIKYLNKLILCWPWAVLIISSLPSTSVAQQRTAGPWPHLDTLAQRQPDSALIQLRKLHAQALSQDDDLKAGISLQQMGQICFDQGHYGQALDLYLQAEKVFQASNYKAQLANNLFKIGILYYYNKQLDKSRLTYNKALALYRQTNDQHGQAAVFGEIGHLFEKRQRYDSAFYYQQRALQGYQKIGSRSGQAKIYENLGSIYEDLERYDTAYVCFTNSDRLYQQDHNTVARIEVLNNIGDVLRKTGRLKESLKLSHQAYALAVSTNNLYQQAAACRDLGKSFQLLKQMDSAYHYVELSRRLSLDVYSKEGLNQTLFLQVLYDINKKSDEIARLNSIRQTNRIITVAVVVVVILLIIIGVVVFSRQRLKIHDQKVLADQQRSIYEAQNDLMQLELRNKELEEQGLKQQLELKTKELSNHTLNLIKNNQLLEGMRATLQQMVKEDKRDQKRQMQQIVQQIDQSFDHEQNWKEFTGAFEQVHQSFFEKLKAHSSDLTSADMRLIALLKVNMDSKDIAGLLGISMDSLRVARHRLRKKLNIEQGDNLSSFIQSL